MEDLHRIFAKLDIERSGSELYLYLLKHGSFSVGQLAKKIGVPRSSLYSTLARLVQVGLVREGCKKGIKYYSAEAPDLIDSLLEKRSSSIAESRKLFSDLLPKLSRESREVRAPPKLSVFEGIHGLENVLRDMLRYADLETCAVWPIRKMMDVLSPKFFEQHNRERIRKNLYTRAIWPIKESVEVKAFPFLGWGEQFKREIRLAPQEVNYVLGYWIYADKVAFLSSSDESYGFIIQSQELVETQQALFEVLWQQSKQLKFDGSDVHSFIKSLER